MIVFRLIKNVKYFYKLHTTIRLININAFKAQTDSQLINSTKKQFKITFFGSDIFSLNILIGLNKLLNDHKICELNVITSSAVQEHHHHQQQHKQSNNKLKRNLVIDYCNQHKIKYFLWSSVKQANNYQDLLDRQDMAIVASFGHLIPSKLINFYPRGVINVHPSLLPRWRGASPIVYSILFNDQVTGVSLMKIMPKHFDIGPILMQKRFDMPADITTLQLIDHSSKVGVDMLSEFIEKYDLYSTKCELQSNENVTYAHKIHSEMYFVDWNNQTYSQIDCQYRALNEISDLKCEFNGKVLKLLNMVKIKKQDLLDLSKPCGYVKYIRPEKTIAVKCKDGYVGFKDVIYRTKLSAKDFYNGYISKKGDVILTGKDNYILKHIYTAKL